MIAGIARHRRNRKGKSLPLINADRRGSGKIGKQKPLKHGGREIAEEQISVRKARSSPIQQLASKSRNMSRYPIVLKDYGFPSYFAPGFRYNEQALVYSGLLAD